LPSGKQFEERSPLVYEQQLALDHTYNLRTSVKQGAVTVAARADLRSLQGSYDFMEKSKFRALMPCQRLGKRAVRSHALLLVRWVHLLPGTFFRIDHQPFSGSRPQGSGVSMS